MQLGFPDNVEKVMRAASAACKAQYHWHDHDHEDECFIVLEGELHLDIQDKGTVTLGPKLGYTMPKGVVHRTRAAQKTVVLMVEAATVTPTIDGRSAAHLVLGWLGI